MASCAFGQRYLYNGTLSSVEEDIRYASWQVLNLNFDLPAVNVATNMLAGYLVEVDNHLLFVVVVASVRWTALNNYFIS